MHENFRAMDAEKRDKIINAAMREFSAKGFKNASSNEIAKKSGISKSLLFYYFSSKEDLFQFLCRYRREFVHTILGPYIQNMPADIFERWRMFAVLRLEIAAQYPVMTEFALSILKDEDPGVQAFLKTLQAERGQFISEFSNKVHEAIDLLRFRTSIDVPKALQIIWWTMEGFGWPKLKEHDSALLHDHEYRESLMAELDGYFAVLKKAFYKEEYL